MRAAAALALLLALGTAPAAQPVHAAGPVCRLDATPPDASAPPARRARRPAPCPPAERRATFEVTYEGFPPEAETAFQAAVDTWACRIASAQPIRIAATWETLGGATLGSAGPRLFSQVPGAPSPDVWYPAALADQIAGRDLDPSTADIEASFNRSFPGWHFDLDSAPDREYDLYTVVLHEIAHGLGLIGSLFVEDDQGLVGQEGRGPFVYDLLTTDGDGVSILDTGLYPPGSAALADALEREVRMAGPAVRAVAAEGAPLYAPRRWVQGASYSHLDEDVFPLGTPDGLMTPFIARDETIDQPGTVTCALLADIGWTLAGDCADRVPPRSAAGGLLVEQRGPNPVRTETTVRLQSDVPRLVSVALVDVLGRRVRDYGRTAIIEGRPTDLTISARDLASGVYVLQVLGGGDPAALSLTVVR